MFWICIMFTKFTKKMKTKLCWMNSHKLHNYLCHMCVYITYWVQCCLYAHVFRTDHFGLDNFWRIMSLEETDSPPLSSHWLPVALQLRVDPCKSCPIHAGMSTGVIIMQALFRQPYCWDCVWAASLSLKKDTTLQKTFWFSGSYNLSVLSLPFF